jgi:transcriptional regulator with XRE-family HTH domain
MSDVYETVAKQFGRNLVRCRKRAGLSQEEVGFDAAIHRTEVGMLERGVRLPRIDTLVKLAVALRVEVGELLDGIEWKPPVPSPTNGQFRVEASNDTPSTT